MCVRLRLSTTTLYWAARAVNVPQMASKLMQDLNVNAPLDSAGEWKLTVILCTHQEGTEGFISEMDELNST